LPGEDALPITLLELRIDNDIQYSRLQLVAPAELRIRNCSFLGLAGFFFMFMAGRLRPN
jgi:hypothetical protein